VRNASIALTETVKFESGSGFLNIT
jgi:hypothetical protein